MMNSTPAGCLLLLRRIDPDVKTLVTALHASLIPLIIGANLVLIVGRTKIKRKKFTSS